MTNEMCACTCGALPVVMLVAAAISSVDPAEADLASCLVSHAIHLGAASQTVNMAREMCEDSGPGDTQTDEVDQLTGDTPTDPATGPVVRRRGDPWFPAEVPLSQTAA